MDTQQYDLMQSEVLWVHPERRLPDFYLSVPSHLRHVVFSLF